MPEVEITGLTRAIVLLDQWIKYARALEAENERLRNRYASAHERCEQLREIVHEDYPGAPF